MGNKKKPKKVKPQSKWGKKEWRAEALRLRTAQKPFVSLAKGMLPCPPDKKCPATVKKVYMRWQDYCGIPSKKRALPKAAFRALSL